MEDDEYTIDISTMSGTTDTITISTNSYVDDWISIDGTFDVSGITLTKPIEFEDHMPAVAKVEDMCNNYPALEKAYENFKTIYKMVHQDWQGRQDEES